MPVTGVPDDCDQLMVEMEVSGGTEHRKVTLSPSRRGKGSGSLGEMVTSRGGGVTGHVRVH